MALRSGHGEGAGVPRIEVLPPDEQPAPVPGALPALTGPVNRGSDGRIADSASAKALGRRGGLRKASLRRLIDTLGLGELAEDSEFGSYRDAAEDFVVHHTNALAEMAGGKCGPAPASIVASAALQLAASRFVITMAARTSDAAMFKTGSQLADASRQNLLAAYELAVREAQARGSRPVDPLDDWDKRSMARSSRLESTAHTTSNVDAPTGRSEASNDVGETKCAMHTNGAHS